MKLAWIPPGSFLMGSPPSEEYRRDDETQHRVTLTKGFFMGIYPITQAQWLGLLGGNPSHFKGEDRPVECISWDDCQKFCQKLSSREGKPYRLPTETEWEYACRANTTTAYCFGENVRQGGFLGFGRTNLLDEYAWYFDNSGNQTHAVGKKKPNHWGLYDMHGNVWEWCQDWYGPYPRTSITDPQSPSSGEARVLRGGFWNDIVRCSRSAFRHKIAPGDRFLNLGFRVCVCLD